MEKNLARQAELAFERQGDYDTLCYEGAWHTSGQMADRGSRLGTGLAGLGVRPGDRLLVLMANCPEVLITYTAAWRAGAVVTPLIFLASEDELRHALNDSGAVGVVTTVEFLPKVSAVLGEHSGRPVRAGPRGGFGGRGGSRGPGARLRRGGLGRARVHRGPVRHRPGRPALHRRHHGPVQGRPAHPRGPVLVRVGRARAVGALERVQLGAAAAAGARLRPAGHLRRHAPHRPHQDHPDALVRPGRVGEAGRGAQGAGQRAGAVDDPDAARASRWRTRTCRAWSRSRPGRRRWPTMFGASSRHGSPARPSTRATGAPRRPRSSRPIRGARGGSAASGCRCPGSSSPSRTRRAGCFRRARTARSACGPPA